MSITMRRAATCVGGVALAISGTTAVAQAAEPVHIDVDEVFVEGGVSTFTSTIDGCASGTVATVNDRTTGGPNFGKFSGFKVLSCAGGGQLVLHLSAKFDNSGSTGTWAIVGSSGAVAGVHGSGTLVGTPTATGINDVYDGTLRP